MLRCSDGSLYTGITTDVPRRVTEHERSPRGSKYLRGRGPLELVLQSEIGDRSLAARAESRIKSLGREAKEQLVVSQGGLRDLLAGLGVKSP